MPLMLIPVAVAFAQVLAASRPAQKLAVQEYRIDAGHTIVEFSVGFGLMRVKGRFPQTHGTILYDPVAPERSTVSVVIESNSIDTGWPHRDEHLRSDDFFDVEQYPTITFRSDRIERTGESWIATGPLTMHGVTKSVAIPFRLIAPPARSAVSGWMQIYLIGGPPLRLARRDFGILGGDKHNSWFTAARNATVPDSVDVSIELEGFWPDDGSERPKPIEEALERIRTTGVAAQMDRWRQRRGTKSDAEWAPYFQGGDMVVRALMADGRTAEAVALSRGLTELFPSLASAWLVHGMALMVSGDSTAAGAAFARALELDPRETRASAWQRRLKG